MRRPRLPVFVYSLAIAPMAFDMAITPAFAAQRAAAQAQIAAPALSASLTGRVVDPTGAVVPGALVTMESAAGSRHTVTTDDGGVNEQVVNDDIAVTRFENFMKVNASANYKLSERVSITMRIENLLNARDLGYSRSVLGSDGSSQRITGTQRDPGTIAGGGLQVRF